MRKLVAIAAIAIAGTLMVPTGAHADNGSGMVNDPGKEAEFVTKINELRAEKGLAPLQVHSQLVEKARGWSHTMAEAGQIWHSHLPDGVTVNWKRLGENVGMGGSVDALHDAFINSPSHYENLVDPGFRYVGIGVTVDSQGTIFVAEEFMELASQPAPAAPKSAAGTPSSQAATATPSGPAASPAPERARSAPRRPAAAPAPTAHRNEAARIVSVLDRLRSLDD